MKYKSRFLFIAVLLHFLMNEGYSREHIMVGDDGQKIRTLIVVFDGLRPDYIRPEWMPNLYAFRNKAVYGKNHHSVFPTVTRVNAASYITGSYPAEHGLMGNSIYIPEVNTQKILNSGNADDLKQVMEATSGKLLTAPSLGELLRSAGEKLFVYSSGSTGQAFLQNHTVNGVVINPQMILPGTFREELIAAVGAPPTDAVPNTERHRWVTDALCRYTLSPEGPLVSAIWLSDPDGTAHEYGMGVPITTRSLQIVDAAFGRILDSIRAKGLENVFNVIVTADHGFVTHIGKQGLSGFLVEKQLKKDKDSDDVILAGGAIYVKDHNREKIKKIVEVLQQEEWVGAIFTKAAKPGAVKGQVKGTLSFDAIRWNHSQRAADILVTVNWNDNPNSLGFAGTDFATGVAGHGGSSPYEIHIPLIAYGPSFKASFESDLPTSNIDIVPTVLFLNKMVVPQQMQGRIMYELLRDNRIPAAVPRKQVIEVKTNSKQRYRLKLEQTVLGKYRYIDYLGVTR